MQAFFENGQTIWTLAIHILPTSGFLGIKMQEYALTRRTATDGRPTKLRPSGNNM
jgi:hypothetical protein